VSHAWANGWQPRDLARFVQRQLGPLHAALCVAVVAAEARAYAGVAMPAHWRDQLVEVGAATPPARGVAYLQAAGRAADAVPTRTITSGIELLAVLQRLAVLPQLCPPPRDWGISRPRPDRRVSRHDPLVAKVRALLAKAESTEFPDEAEALTAKAQELITRHAIDDALLAADATSAVPAGRRIPIDEPYVSAKAQLLHAVADANRCQAIQSGALGFSTVMGFESDLDTVELLFASLLVQATRALAHEGRGVDGASARRPAFRRAFLYGFAAQIRRRLTEVVEQQVGDATRRHGPDLLPVLARREADVHHAVMHTFPHLVTKRVSFSDGAGWAAGSAAGRAALLSLDGDVAPGLTA
jgi:hypothetical protein